MRILAKSSFIVFLFVLVSCDKTDCEGLKNTEWMLVQLDTIAVKNTNKNRAWFIKFKDDTFTFGEKGLSFNGKFSTENDSLVVEYSVSNGFSQNYKTKYEVSKNCDTLILHTDFYRLLHEKFKVKTIYVKK